jgi:DNA-binding beta-propeller fold protein YncE
VIDYVSGLVSIIDARTCRAGNTSNCLPRATVNLGHHPWRGAVDPATDTLYVTLFNARAVAVIDARSCNGHQVGGCGQRPARIHVGSEPEGLAFDDAASLGFVTNAGSDSVSVFDTTHCRGADTTGCGPTLGKVRVGGLPDGIAFDSRTSTLYVTVNTSTTLGLAVLKVS